MFLPDGCDTALTFPLSNDHINWVGANRERTIIAILTNSSLYFYSTNHQLLLCTFKRSDNEVAERGFYKKLYWRHNSKSICVITDNNFVYIYAIEVSQNADCFNLVDSTSTDFPVRQSPELYLKQRRPIVSITLAVVAKLESQPQCVVSLKDELFISLMDGWIHRLGWNGDVLQELSFSIRQIFFSVDQISAKAEKFPQSSLCVIDLVYCPLIGGLCAVLSDGHAALLVSSSPQFQPSGVCAVWASGMNDAVCCTVNHKFRLVYFGCKNGDIVGYSLDDTNGALVRIFRVAPSAKNGTEYLSRIGAVRQIQCIAQGSVFAVIWHTDDKDKNDSSRLSSLSLEDGDTPKSGLSECPPLVAIFSPFGARWWNSLESVLPSNLCCEYTSMDWGPDGYQLWLGTNGRGPFNINFARSLLGFRERVAMMGSDRVYLSPLRSYEANASAPHFIWEMCKLPYEYISTNWPLRYVGMDDNCNRVLVAAGTKGFCVCSLKNFKWRLFRKEAQEENLCLTADIIVYKEFVIVAVCNTTNENDAIYAFNFAEQLDIDLAVVSLFVNRIIATSLSQDYLITFDVASVITIYSLKQTATVDATSKQPKFGLELVCFAEIRVAELLPHPSCVVSIQLTQLHYYSDMAEFCPGYDSLLINVSGHLLLLSPLHSHTSTKDQESTLQLHPPTLIASCVERVWTYLTNRKIPHLNKALWINTGCRKMQIWLPLSQKPTDVSMNGSLNADASATTQRTFISKRIMLPIDLNLYPLAIDEDCLACGAESFNVEMSRSYDEILTPSVGKHDDLSKSSKNEDNSENMESYKSKGNDATSSNDTRAEVLPIPKTKIFSPTITAHSLIRITEVFLHHLLKQMLKRNLGSYALAIASACRSLPYFSHVLELLLHDVLDEEATSSEPIPDPLLPTVVSFIHEFPEYLQTVVHCARKTELAFWNLLFSVSHHPRELFKKCMEEEELDTATCCLILLQSMEPLSLSIQSAAQLLEEALGKRRWALARDIVRFMQSIDRSELDGNLESPPLFQKLTSRTSTKQKCSILPADASATDEIMFSASGGSGSAMSGNIATGVTMANNRGSIVAGNSMSSAIYARRQSGENRSSGPHSKIMHTPNILSVSTNSAQHQGAGAANATALRTSPNAANFAPMRMNSIVRLLTKNPSLDSGNYCNSTTPFLGFEHFDDILMHHGAALLEDYALRDFGAFASHLNLDLKSFFANAANAFHIAAEEFPLVLMKLHAQFAWPYPMTTNGSVIFAASKMRNSDSSYSDLNGSMTKLSDKPSNATLSAVNEAQSTKTFDDTISVNSFSTTTSSLTEQSFSWKAFEKLCTKNRGTIQCEAELVFLMDWLASETDALEWIYLLCILKQDAHRFNEKVINELNNQKRLALFLKNVHTGTANLYAWAEAKCPAYAPIIRVFKEFLDG